MSKCSDIKNNIHKTRERSTNKAELWDKIFVNKKLVKSSQVKFCLQQNQNKLENVQLVFDFETLFNLKVKKGEKFPLCVSLA
jgi:hypothetical protein